MIAVLWEKCCRIGGSQIGCRDFIPGRNKTIKGGNNPKSQGDGSGLGGEDILGALTQSKKQSSGPLWGVRKFERNEQGSWSLRCLMGMWSPLMFLERLQSIFNVLPKLFLMVQLVFI